MNFSFLGILTAKDWGWTLDLRQRWREEGENFDQFIASGYIIKKLSPKFALGLGIDHIQNHPSGKESFEENRITSQMQYKFDDIAGIKIQSRTRFEFRRREQFDDIAYRLREQMRASYPLNFNPNISLVMFDELLLNLNSTDWKVARGIDQNRVFVGMGYQANTHVNIEFGYLNQYINTQTINRENHVLNTTLRYQF